MANTDCKVLKDYGVIAKHDDLTLELKYISWYGNPPKYDLRSYKNGTPLKGMVFTHDEITTLSGILDEYLKNAKEELQDIPKQVESGKKRGRPAKAKAESVIPEHIQAKLDALKVAPKKTEEKSNVIQFPKERPEIKKVVTNGNATYEDCVKKLGKDKAIFKDDDSQYVIDGLLELCKVDGDFRNNVMREGKDFSGVMLYMAKMCKAGYGYLAPDKQSGWVSRDLGLSMAIDYFNMPDEPKPEPIKTETKTKTRGRKKKGA